MRIPREFTSAVLGLLALVLMSAAGRAADPGFYYPDSAEASDQKTGSVLIYNLYTSGAGNPNAQNTRLTITNAHPNNPVSVHLFFVADNGTVADAFICLTQNQTASFLASDIDPGVTGYVVAIASDNISGCPLWFNFLAGTAHIKLSSGHSASLSAEAIAMDIIPFTSFAPESSAASFVLPGCNESSVTAVLAFNGIIYNRAARALAIDKIGSPADGNSTLLVINSLSGNLAIGLTGIGSLSGRLFDNAAPANSYPFTVSSSGSQFRAVLSDSFPATTPSFSAVIPSGRTGWMKIWTTSDRAISGAVINFNSNTAGSPTAFSGGRNLRKLTQTDSGGFTIPIFPAAC